MALSLFPATPEETVEKLEWVALLLFSALAKARAPCRYPSDLDPGSNAGRGPKTTQPVGREAAGGSGGVARSLQPAVGMRLARFLPSAPSASTRNPLQYFNSLLEHVMHLRAARLAAPSRRDTSYLAGGEGRLGDRNHRSRLVRARCAPAGAPGSWDGEIRWFRFASPPASICCPSGTSLRPDSHRGG